MHRDGFSPRRISALMFASASFLLGACSFGPVDSVESAETTPEAPSTPDELALVDEAGATVRLALVEPASWDPALLSVSDQAAVIVADLAFDGLVQVAASGTELEPAMATSWAVDDSVTVWTFELEPGRADAATVVASFERLMGESGLSSSLLSHVESVEAIEGESGAAVVFSLGRPDAGFAWLLSGVPYSVVGVDGASTSQYVVETSAAGVTFEKEPDSSDQGSNSRDIEITWVEDTDEAARMVIDGDADGAVLEAGQRLGIANELSTSGVDSTTSRFYAINGYFPLFASELRSAIALSFDRESLAGLTPAATLTNGLASSGFAGAIDDACQGACALDQAEARLLVTEFVEAFGEAPQVTVGYVDADEGPQAEAVADGLAEVGFQAVAERYSPGGLVEAVENGEVAVFSAGWIAPSPTIDAVIPGLLSSTSALNLSRAASVEIDELLAEAATTLDDARRWELLAAAESAALAQHLFVPLTVGSSSFVGTEGLEGIGVRPDGSLLIAN